MSCCQRQHVTMHCRRWAGLMQGGVKPEGINQRQQAGCSSVTACSQAFGGSAPDFSPNEYRSADKRLRHPLEMLGLPKCSSKVHPKVGTAPEASELWPPHLPGQIYGSQKPDGAHRLPTATRRAAYTPWQPPACSVSHEE